MSEMIAFRRSFCHAFWAPAALEAATSDSTTATSNTSFLERDGRNLSQNLMRHLIGDTRTVRDRSAAQAPKPYKHAARSLARKAHTMDSRTSPQSEPQCAAETDSAA